MNRPVSGCSLLVMIVFGPHICLAEMPQATGTVVLPVFLVQIIAPHDKASHCAEDVNRAAPVCENFSLWNSKETDPANALEVDLTERT